MGTKKQRLPQRPKKRWKAQAEERGIVGVRRKLDPEHYPLFEEAIGRLEPEIKTPLGDFGRLLAVRSLAVTVVGFRKFNRKHREHGPPTFEVVRGVKSLHAPIEATLGNLSIFGAEGKRKMGFELESAEMLDEIKDCEKAFSDFKFRRQNFPLAIDPRRKEITPHCSVVFMFDEFAPDFDNPDELARLTSVTQVKGKKVSFIPPEPHN